VLATSSQHGLTPVVKIGNGELRRKSTALDGVIDDACITEREIVYTPSPKKGQ
jgi:hypothetical protein